MNKSIFNKYTVNQAIWIATALMSAEVYTEKTNITISDICFKQVDIIKRAQRYTKDKIDAARVSWWLNGDNEKSTYNFLREGPDGKTRRLAMIDEFNEKTYPEGLDILDKFEMDEVVMTMEELIYFVREQYPSILKKGTGNMIEFEKIIDYIDRFKGKKYIKPDKAGNKSSEMIDFKEMGTKARTSFMDYAYEIIKHFPDMKLHSCSNWINAGQVCPNYLWIELKKKGYEDSVHSLSLAIADTLESDVNIKNIISFRIEIRDQKATFEDYDRHNKLVEVPVLVDSGIFLMGTTKDEKSYNYGTDYTKAKNGIETGNVKKLKAVKTLSKPYTIDRSEELVEEGIKAVEMLLPFYEHIIKAENDGFWPSLDEYNPNISKEEWIKYLSEVETPNYKLSMEMLVGILKLGGQASCKQLSEVYGGDVNSYIMSTVHLGRRVKKYFNKPSCMDEGQERFYVYMFQGKRMAHNDNSYYVYRMRPELKAALEEIDLSNIDPKCNGESEIEDMNNIGIDKNTILYGPPGTGKTYVTSEYAVAIVENKPLEVIKEEDHNEVYRRYMEYKEKGLIEFVTFHQSYGYEEFIEGIKPIVTEKSDRSRDIAYKIEDGLFKKFCNYANKYKVLSEDIHTEGKSVWSIMVDSKEEMEICWEYETVGIKSYGVPADYRDETLPNDMDSSISSILIDFQYEMREGDLVLLTNNSDKTQFLGVISGNAIYDDLESKEYPRRRPVRWYKEKKDVYKVPNVECCRLNTQTKNVVETFLAEGIKNYVFIIDEINRGNISKIFGELITLIETSKRLGKKEEMKATLPYSHEEFGVPDNVYILGTMNTADRSIALMDTALRRRFDFVEMMPDSEVLKGIEVDGLNISEMLDKINERIVYLYDREHTIGHAFFTKLAENNDIDMLKSIFEKSVIPLLQEYFYEDYYKIQLVLGDNAKEDMYKFILDEKTTISNIFKGNVEEDLDNQDVKYIINKPAFSMIESYKGII